MKRFIDVHTGEITAGQGEVILASDTNNACLVIAAYDANKKVGALAHAIYANGQHNHTSPVLRDVNHAVDELIRDMVMLGSQIEDIEISLVAGENVPHHENPSYHRSIEEAIRAIKDHHLRIKNDVCEEVGAAHISLDIETGKVICK